MSRNAKSAAESASAPADEWLGGRRWTGILAIGFVIVIGVCLVVVLNARGTPGGTPSAPREPAGGGQGDAPTALPRLGAPGPGPLPTGVPTIAPGQTVWTIYDSVALPSIPGAGPAHVEGAIAVGYAHTPLGALLAAVNESYRYVLAPDETWRAAADAMLLPGPGKDAWLRVRAEHPYGSAGAVGEGGLAQVAGFRFVSYLADEAVIQLVTRGGAGDLLVGTDHVHWTGADWQLVPATDGGPNGVVGQAESLQGFAEWRGV